MVRRLYRSRCRPLLIGAAAAAASLPRRPSCQGSRARLRELTFKRLWFRGFPSDVGAESWQRAQRSYESINVIEKRVRSDVPEVLAETEKRLGLLVSYGPLANGFSAVALGTLAFRIHLPSPSPVIAQKSDTHSIVTQSAQL